MRKSIKNNITKDGSVCPYLNIGTEAAFELTVTTNSRSGYMAVFASGTSYLNTATEAAFGITVTTYSRPSSMALLTSGTSYLKPASEIDFGILNVVIEDAYIKNYLNEKYHPDLDLVVNLSIINLEFEGMWKGAIYSWYSTNPDKVRHTSTSIREIFLHPIHKLSPTNQIQKWNSGQLFYYKNGNPLRRTMLLYIFRNSSNTIFVEQPIQNILDHIELLNGRHT